MEGMGQTRAGGSEPGLGFVEAVLVAEAGFKYAGLHAGAEDLQGENDEKNEEEHGRV